MTSTGRCNIYTLSLEREMLKMKQRRRIYYSSEQRNLMWDRWQRGDSMRVIAVLFDRGHSSVQRILSDAGGIRPRQRSRSRLALTLSEREEISRGVVSGQSIRCWLLRTNWTSRFMYTFWVLVEVRTSRFIWETLYELGKCYRSILAFEFTWKTLAGHSLRRLPR